MLEVILVGAVTALVVGVAVRATIEGRRIVSEQRRDPEEMIQALCIACNEFRLVEHMRYVKGEKGGFKCHPSC